MQTLTLQGRIPQLAEKREPVSYGKSPSFCLAFALSRAHLLPSGPCQFPTLGFVVSRYTQVKSFSPELFWYIFLALSRPTSSSEAEATEFKWRRGHLFEHAIAAGIYQHVLSDPVARVLKVTQKPTKKWCVRTRDNIPEHV